MKEIENNNNKNKITNEGEISNNKLKAGNEQTSNKINKI